MSSVLVVDDSLTVRMDLVEALEAAGIHVVACGSLAEARAIVSSTPLAAAIIDLLLPDGTGVELIAELRAHLRYASLPIVMLSTEAEVKDRLHGLAIGATDYVGKPYETESVIARVRGFLARTSAPRERLVLVIDDSDTFRAAIVDELERAGFRTLACRSGADGLRAAAVHRPAAIVVDGQMPEMDGRTVIRRVRLDPVLRTTPCVLLTGSEGADAEILALEAGADAFVTKDAGPEVIIARLGVVLRATFRETTVPIPIAPHRVLAIDDSATYLAAVSEALREDGYDVVVASTGEDAIELLAAQAVDCILLDPVLPGLSGAETCRRIKAAPGLRDIPLIMVTAHDGRIEMIDGLAAGADDFLAKAAGFDILRARMQAQIRRRRFEDEHRRARELVITNRRIEEASRLKSEFLANMSHELRTPLNAIIGFAELLHDKTVPVDSPEHDEFLGDILASGRHLLQLINDVLDLAKVEAGKLEFRPEPVDPRLLVGEVLAVLRAQALQKQITITLVVDPAITELVIDPARLKQVAYNFLSNALKFTPAGRTIDVRVVPDGVERFRLEVEDHGIGIGAADLPQLFVEFNQLEAGATKHHAGTGLGLALTKRLVEAQGGNVGVTSKLGVGSTFFASLPRSATTAARADRRA